MEKITQTKEMYEVSLRSIGAWNREIIERMKSNNLDIPTEPIDTKKIMEYAQNDVLREQEQFNDTSAMKAVIFLEWLAEKKSSQN